MSGQRDASPKGNVNREKIARGRDEMESIKLIVQENMGLYNRVLQKIRVQRALSSESIFDSVAAKKEADKKKDSKENKDK